MRRGVLLLAAVGAVSCGTDKKEAGAAPAAARPVSVRVAQVEMKDWDANYTATGTVRARSTAMVSSRVSGTVLTVAAREGDRVAAGQTLATLDSRDLETAVRRAEAGLAEARSALPEYEASLGASKTALDLAEATFRRMSELYGKKSISNQEFDEAQARVKQARANDEILRARRAQLAARVDRAEQERRAAEIELGYAKIVAPFAGVVTERRVEPGSLASPGAPLVAIESDAGFRLEVQVEESKLAGVRVGGKARAQVDAAGCDATGTVDEIAAVGDAGSRTYVVKIATACKGLRGGMFGRAVFAGAPRKAVAVPMAAVVTRGAGQAVFVVESGTAKLRLVSLGERAGDWVEALSGLSGGESVVVGPAAGLQDGAAAEVVR